MQGQSADTTTGSNSISAGRWSNWATGASGGPLPPGGATPKNPLATRSKLSRGAAAPGKGEPVGGYRARVGLVTRRVSSDRRRPSPAGKIHVRHRADRGGRDLGAVSSIPDSPADQTVDDDAPPPRRACAQAASSPAGHQGPAASTSSRCCGRSAAPAVRPAPPVPAFCVFSAAICASLSSGSIRSRAFSARSVTASPGTPPVPGISGTPELHQSRALRNQYDTLSRLANVLNPHERQHRHVTSAPSGAAGCGYRWSAATCNGEEPRSAVDAGTARPRHHGHPRHARTIGMADPA